MFALLIGTLTACLFLFLPGGAMDLFLLPKEAALGIGSWLCGMVLLRRRDRSPVAALEEPAGDGHAVAAVTIAAAGFLAWCTCSAATHGADFWLASRPLALWADSAILLVAAMRLRPVLTPDVMRQVAKLVAACSAIGLAQALRLMPDLSPQGQFPGGTVGGRNHLAFVIVLSIPAIIGWTVHSRRAAGQWASYAVLTTAGAMLSLTRSRTAWLALGAMALTTIALVAMRRARVTRARCVATSLCLLAGISIGVMLAPIAWRSSGSIADSARRIVDLSSGSGRGRVLQARTALAIARSHPLAGVGTGNWARAYFAAAPLDDPTVNLAFVEPVSPHPQSDWTGTLAEAGVPGLVLLAAVPALLILIALRAIFIGSPSKRSRAVVLLVSIAGAAFLSLGDSLARSPTAVALVAVSWGALAGGLTSSVDQVAWPTAHSWMRKLSSGALCLLVVASAFGALAQVRRAAAVVLLMRATTVTDIETAARLDPGRADLQVQLARHWIEGGRCDSAAPFLRRAQALVRSPAVDIWDAACRQAKP